MTRNTQKDGELFIIKMRWLLIMGSPLMFWIFKLQTLQTLWQITFFMIIYNSWLHYFAYRHEHTKMHQYLYSIIDLLYVSSLYYLGFGKQVDFHQFYYFLILVLGIRFGMHNYYGLVVLIGLIYLFVSLISNQLMNSGADIIRILGQVTYFIIFGVLTSFLLLRERVQQEEKELLITQLKAAYEQLYLHNVHVEEMAITDPLTGVYNYRFFSQRLNQEIEMARRYRRQLSLIILDIDKFKDFNDSYGHPAGDKALKEVTTVFKDNIRDLDILARYGGEEFLILLPEAGTEESFMVAERIRQAVENHAIKMDDESPMLYITVSGGIATYPEDAETADKLLKIADNVLYEGKNKGRNIICRPR